MTNLNAHAWPLARLNEAINALAYHSGLTASLVATPTLAPPEKGNGRSLSRYIETTTAAYGIEAEPLTIRYGQVQSTIDQLKPLLLRLPDDADVCFLAILAQTKQGVKLIGPDLTLRYVPPEDVCAGLRAHLEQPYLPMLDQILTEADVPERRLSQVTHAILQERLGQHRVSDGWLLRLSPGTAVKTQAKNARLPQLLAGLLVVYIPKILIWLSAWWVLAQGALQGEPNWGWLIAWGLMLFTNMPFRLLEPWFGGLFSIVTGWLFKKRLLFGVLQLKPEEIRHQGAGQLLSRAIEAESVETLALDGGTLILSHTIDLLLAVPLLVSGVGGWLHVGLLVGWMGVVLGGTAVYFRQRKQWTQQRLHITHDLIERMVGHQTRLAQESPTHWHDGEDEALSQYLRQSQKMDRIAAIIQAVMPRGWLFLGLLAIAPAFVSGSSTPATLSLALGGTLFIYPSLRMLGEGLLSVADAFIAWENVAPLFHAADRQQKTGAAHVLSSTNTAASEQPVFEAGRLQYTYPGRSEAVLANCDLKVYADDRVLLEGPSGSGKSTFASLVMGMRAPDAGLMLLDGLDPHTLGWEGWRQQVAAAPQFHENHVFMGTFAFNLLLGRGWPPQAEDFAEAQAICTELGLGPLLARMPAGMLQMVGEVGWQLSHGERSRLYMARALLQGANLIVLDESFAALDPDNLHTTMQCVLKRAPALMVIAHP